MACSISNRAAEAEYFLDKGWAYSELVHVYKCACAISTRTHLIGGIFADAEYFLDKGSANCERSRFIKHNLWAKVWKQTQLLNKK